MEIKITVLGIPQPKQSARFRIQKFGNKSFVKSYQKKEVIDSERNFAFDAKRQLPKDFKLMSGPILLRALFIFPPLKSFTKTKLKILDSGGTIFKDTKPDLQDNLMKGVIDSLEGVVFLNDSQICEVHSRKIYGLVPRVVLEFEQIL